MDKQLFKFKILLIIPIILEQVQSKQTYGAAYYSKTLNFVYHLKITTDFLKVQDMDGVVKQEISLLMTLFHFNINVLCQLNSRYVLIILMDNKLSMVFSQLILYFIMHFFLIIIQHVILLNQLIKIQMDNNRILKDHIY